MTFNCILLRELIPNLIWIIYWYLCIFSRNMIFFVGYCKIYTGWKCKKMLLFFCDNTFFHDENSITHTSIPNVAKFAKWRPNCQILLVRPAIIFIIFWDSLMFYQIFFSPQVKRSEIIIYKHGIYEFPHELSNDLRLRILGN